jgi:hypothetical protein
MSTADKPCSGQPCLHPGCDGVLRVETSRVRGEYRRRYLKCNKCGVAPANNIQLVPLYFAPRQPARGKTPPPTSYT